MPVRVFISYSHDSEDHRVRVLALAQALRGHGIDADLDQFHGETLVHWPSWCRQRMDPEHSDFVLCICTAEYRQRINGNVAPEQGKGVYWEGTLMQSELYDGKGNRRYLAVLFDDEPELSIVECLRGWTQCRVRQFALTDDGYELLLRVLTGQPRATPAAALQAATMAAGQAVDGLRKAGQDEFIVRGLLTRACVLHGNGDAAAARADLMDAERIAERGGMKLHLADVHLHRARLFRDRTALAAARKLIDEIGYERRRGELDDAQCWFDGRTVVLPEFESLLAQARGENLPEPPPVPTPTP